MDYVRDNLTQLLSTTISQVYIFNQYFTHHSLPQNELQCFFSMINPLMMSPEPFLKQDLKRFIRLSIGQNMKIKKNFFLAHGRILRMDCVFTGGKDI